ncbi:LysR family transcriptional regulator [Pseudomonas sp. GD03842]|uniref:LysR family transcriptional regulator n=1 Tax=Pseudomonas sp. GD03842 TaxID=2975385 RepID=UPI00244AAF0A|nr:LysR family transcriptional regulator [Pseudomonas sp. GD03842]MDH0747024.1 LysR family transcriptional regulator [Pseudomonas sp. GD03842]
MDRFESMAMLVAAIDNGSLSAAGRVMHVPLPTLSRKITELEARLGTRLLIRGTRKLTLTDAGVAYVAAARRILEQVDDAEREAAGEFQTPKGELVITAPVFFGRLHVLPVVTDFLALYPEINVRLLLVDHNMHLIDEHVDMAVRIGKLPDSALYATYVGPMRSMVCASPHLLATHGVPTVPDDLRRFPIVRVAMPVPTPGWQFRSPDAGGVVDIPVSPRLAVSTAEAAVQAAIRGVGVVNLMRYQVLEAIQAGQLKPLLEPFELDPSPIHLLHASRGQMPLKMRCFLDFARPRLQAILA